MLEYFLAPGDLSNSNQFIYNNLRLIGLLGREVLMSMKLSIKLVALIGILLLMTLSYFNHL